MPEYKNMQLRQIVTGFFLLSSALAPSPVLAGANPLQVQAETMITFRERVTDTPADKETTVIPLYEYLQLDYDSSVTGLSFHGYGWGRGDLSGSGYFQKDADGEFLSGYMQYQPPEFPGVIRLGRQQIFAGLTDKIVDGLSVNSRLGAALDVSAYGGVTLSPDTREDKTSRIWGGRLASPATFASQAGVSYQKIESSSGSIEETAGFDVTIGLPGNIDLAGISIWNLESRDLGELSLEMGFKVTDLHFRPYVRRFQYADLIASGSSSVRPFNYLAASGETLSVAGVDIDWQKNEILELGFRGKALELEHRDEGAIYLSTLLIRHWRNLSQAGVEFGLMNGDSAENEYTLGRAYFYYDNLSEILPFDFISGDIVLVHYQQKIYNTDHSFFASMGAGKKILADAMEIKLSMDYSFDPYFSRDIKGGLVLSYLLP